jgi:hypothetical protein
MALKAFMLKASSKDRSTSAASLAYIAGCSKSISCIPDQVSLQVLELVLA